MKKFFFIESLILFRTKDLPSFINNRLSSRCSECIAARFKYPASRPGGGGRYTLPFRFETSRVATVKQLLRKSGFSRGAASDMSRCVRESTSNVYQSKWLTFCNWCRGRGVAPVNASVPLIVDFFRHLVRDKGLSVPAVRG